MVTVFGAGCLIVFSNHWSKTGTRLWSNSSVQLRLLLLVNVGKWLFLFVICIIIIVVVV